MEKVFLFVASLHSPHWVLLHMLFFAMADTNTVTGSVFPRETCNISGDKLPERVSLYVGMCVYILGYLTSTVWPTLAVAYALYLTEQNEVNFWKECLKECFLMKERMLCSGLVSPPIG